MVLKVQEAYSTVFWRRHQDHIRFIAEMSKDPLTMLQDGEVHLFPPAPSWSLSWVTPPPRGSTTRTQHQVAVLQATLLSVLQCVVILTAKACGTFLTWWVTFVMCAWMWTTIWFRGVRCLALCSVVLATDCSVLLATDRPRRHKSSSCVRGSHSSWSQKLSPHVYTTN